MFSEGPTRIPHLLMQAYLHLGKTSSIMCTNEKWLPILCMNEGAFPHTACGEQFHRQYMCSIVLSRRWMYPYSWTNLQEQCVEEANDMAKQRNGSIHTCKHREIGHGLAQYDHSGCGHWGGWVEILLSIFFRANCNLVTISNIGYSVQATNKV